MFGALVYEPDTLRVQEQYVGVHLGNNDTPFNSNILHVKSKSCILRLRSQCR